MSRAALPSVTVVPLIGADGASTALELLPAGDGGAPALRGARRDGPHPVGRNPHTVAEIVSRWLLLQVAAPDASPVHEAWV